MRELDIQYSPHACIQLGYIYIYIYTQSYILFLICNHRSYSHKGGLLHPTPPRLWTDSFALVQFTTVPRTLKSYPFKPYPAILYVLYMCLSLVTTVAEPDVYARTLWLQRMSHTMKYNGGRNKAFLSTNLLNGKGTCKSIIIRRIKVSIVLILCYIWYNYVDT